MEGPPSNQQKSINLYLWYLKTVFSQILEYILGYKYNLLMKCRVNFEKIVAVYSLPWIKKGTFCKVMSIA